LRDLALARYTYLRSRVRLQALTGGSTAEVIDEINGWLVPPATVSSLGDSGTGVQSILSAPEKLVVTEISPRRSAATANPAGVIPGD
jgi:hypothetical protein